MQERDRRAHAVVFFRVSRCMVVTSRSSENAAQPLAAVVAAPQVQGKRSKTCASHETRTVELF